MALLGEQKRPGRAKPKAKAATVAQRNGTLDELEDEDNYVDDRVKQLSLKGRLQKAMPTE